MTAAEWISIIGGSGLLWRLLGFLGRYVSEPGPILALSSANVVNEEKNSVYPRVLEIENVGNKAAFETTWEVRLYYPEVPPSFGTERRNKLIPVKPQERFLLDVVKEASEPKAPGHHDLSMAHCGIYEILLWYRGPNRVRYFSHISVWLGDLKQHRAGINPFERVVSLVALRIWMAHFWFGAGIQLKVRLRPYKYKLEQRILALVKGQERKP